MGADSRGEALQPCPFCGGEALGIDHPPHTHFIATFMPDHPGSYSVECVKCSVGLIAATQAEAEAAWNQRAEPLIVSNDITIVTALNALDQLALGDKETGRVALEKHYLTCKEALASLRSSAARSGSSKVE